MDYNYEDEYYYEQYGGNAQYKEYTMEEAAVGIIPSFVSEPQHILVNEGDTFNIHCMVDQLGKKRDKTWVPCPLHTNNMIQARSC